MVGSVVAPRVLTGLVLAGCLAGSAPAPAQTAACGALQAQYIDALQASRTARGSNGDVARLSQQLSQAQSAARLGNCNSFLFFGPRRSPQCPQITAEIRRLQSELSRRNGRFTGRDPQAAWRAARVRDALISNGCSIPRDMQVATGGIYRTLCVRTCDGYYFPISNASARGRAETDAQVCQSMYAQPGQAELFMQRSGADVVEATSLDGRRYGEQPYAFSYRESYDAACARQLKDGLAALAERFTTAQPNATPVALGARITAPLPVPVPVPTPRPPRYEDPETLANAAGGLQIAPVAPKSPAAPAGMRVVGADYYLDMLNTTPRPSPSPRKGIGLIGGAAAAEMPDGANPAVP